jgi:mediator of RNA polymerase II transcription subunit 12, fungi type
MQYGDHRPLAAVTLIRRWHATVTERAQRREYLHPDELLQDSLFAWLDSSVTAGQHENLKSITLLFGYLVKEGFFSFAEYLQRLVARGEASFVGDRSDSRHRLFIRWIPLLDATSSLLKQRSLLLYGPRVRSIPEDTNEKEARFAIRHVLPELFGGRFELPLTILFRKCDNVYLAEENASISTRLDLFQNCEPFFQVPRFEQTRTVYLWLLPLLHRSLPAYEHVHSFLFILTCSQVGFH